MVCPVPGAAFSSDFGQPRTGHTHQGNDMFAPMSTPNLAVVGGNITYGDGGSGGMGAYLDGDNGVTYVYYHLSQYVGGPRHVAQGEVIAKLGMTGNAGAPHTHFEIRPGGRTAPAVNPYPTLVKIC
jgi:murein DD-endopeptidase MepM/ murein hydrolase activator NlpD